MDVRYNHQGKIFTNVQSKVPVVVIIQTTKHRIRGTIHVHPQRRLLDELNEPTEFVPITEGQIHESNGVRQVGFIALNKSQILWITPAKNFSDAGS
jgi:hypothetical protein